LIGVEIRNSDTSINMDLADRIKTIITVNNLTSSSFADKVGVQRSGVSHILNGRNRPSMDFLLKVVEAFPRVDPGWLLTGKSPEKAQSKDSHGIDVKALDIQAPDKSRNLDSFDERRVEKIVIFYTDHTFETYNPSSQ